MITIGDFSRLGGVSIRVLRHYDAIGLLRPAYVDPDSGYRYYRAAQLARLNRIIALKELGFTLKQVSVMLDDALGSTELRGMLRLRRAELEARVAADLERLTRVEARLSIIERETMMPENEVIIKRVPAVRVAEMRGFAAGYEPQSIAPVVGPLFEKLCGRLAAAGVMPCGPTIAYYEPADDGIVIHAACPIDSSADLDPNTLGEEIGLVDLPEIEAATMVYHGSMDRADQVVQELARWIEANGYVGSGYAREVYLDVTGERDEWVTEFQEPIRRIRPGDER